VGHPVPGRPPPRQGGGRWSTAAAPRRWSRS
jgi:hypothetical protein